MPAALTVTLVLLAAPLMAQTEINETRPLGDSATLSVSNVSGSVKITGWNRNEVQVTGTLGKGAEELRISGTSSHMDIEVVLPQHSRNVKPTQLVISLPRSCRLEVSTVSASIDLNDFDGDVELASVSGEITAVCGAGGVGIETVSGGISLGCDSAKTAVESVSGDIRVRGIHGQISGNTVSGDLLVEGGAFSSIIAESVSGNIQFDCGLTGGARVEVSAHSGDVVFLLANDLSARCEVDTFSGNITNGFGPAGVENEYGPGRELEFTAGSGDGHLEIDTFSGNVVLKKK
jgi:DUF4097 and DUF4098 domain-containing protein YvlB